MSLTNKGLVDYAKKCLSLNNNSIYVYGTFGQLLTQALINQKVSQYSYNVKRKKLYEKALKSGNKIYAFDCVGLIKSYLWGGYGNVKYNAKQDVSANGMLSVAKKKGSIKTLPEVPGILVQMDGHIGIYIGNKEVIECTPNKKFAKQKYGAGGVCKTKLSARKWTSWCECPWITYEDKKQETKKEENKTETKIKTKTVKALLGLILRKEPTTKSKRIIKIPNKSKVAIIKENYATANGYKWDKVKYAGLTGYVANKYLK